MTLNTDRPDRDSITKEEVIEALNGQRLAGVDQCSDPEASELIIKAWNEAIGDCVIAINKL